VRAAFKGEDEITMEGEIEAIHKKHSAVREIVERLNGLESDVEKAKARVARAAEEFEELKQRRKEYAVRVVEGWGKDPTKANIYDPALNVETYYQHFASIDAAIAGWPSAEKHLAAKLAEAEKALADFRKANDLDE
jgi:hypothetical protein